MSFNKTWHTPTHASFLKTFIQLIKLMYIIAIVIIIAWYYPALPSIPVDVDYLCLHHIGKDCASRFTSMAYIVFHIRPA